MDVIRLACEQAADDYGHGKRVFNAACFSQALERISGCKQLLDGKMVRAILSGRSDIIHTGGYHYRLRQMDTNKDEP